MSINPKDFVKESDSSEWKSSSDPFIWFHRGAEITIETVRDFSDERLDSPYREWTERTFPESDFQNPAYTLGGVRLKLRGVPYYECDVIRVEWVGGRVFLTLPHGLDEGEQSRLGGFGYELSEVMTGKVGDKEFDEVLDEVGIEVSD